MSFAHLFWWAIGAFGVGGAALIACGIFLGWPVVLAFLNTKLGRIVALIGAVLAAFVFVYGKGKSDGSAADKAKQEKENADFVNAQATRDAADAQLSDDQLNSRLRDNGNTGPR